MKKEPDLANRNGLPQDRGKHDHPLSIITAAATAATTTITTYGRITTSICLVRNSDE